MIDKLCNFIKKCIFVYSFIFISSIIGNDNLDDAERYILNLFSDKSYSQIRDVLKKSKKVPEEYREEIFKHLYDYYILKMKKEKVLSNELVVNFFITFGEECNKKINYNIDEKAFFTEFINKNKIFSGISFELYQALNKTLRLLLEGQFSDIIEKAIKNHYGVESVMPVVKIKDTEYLIYDLLEGNIVNQLPDKIFPITLKNLMDGGSNGGAVRFEELFKSKSKVNIIFDVSEYNKEDLLSISKLFQDLKKYALDNRNIKIFTTFDNDGGIIRDEIISGKHTAFDDCDEKISKILQSNMINKINIFCENDYSTLFRRAEESKKNVFIIQIPECLNYQAFKNKQMINLIDSVYGMKMNSYIVYKIVKNDNKDNKIYFVPAAASPIYTCDNLILNNNINDFTVSKKNEESVLLKKIMKYGVDSIEKIKYNSIDEIKDFRAFFLDDLFSNLIFIAQNEDNWVNGSIIFNARDITRILKQLMIKLAEQSNFLSMDDKNIIDIPSCFINQLIFKLKEINIPKGKYIFFEFLNNNIKEINDYIDKKDNYVFISHEDVKKKLKTLIINKVKKNKFFNYISKIDIIAQKKLEEKIEEAYDDIINQRIFSNEQLENQTYEIYLINENKNLSIKDKIRLRDEIKIKFLTSVSQKDLHDYFEYSENRPNLVFVNTSVLPSEKEANNFLKYISDNNFEELRWHLKDDFSKDIIVSKKIIASFIRDNFYFFKNKKKNEIFTALKSMILESNINIQVHYDTNNKYYNIIKPYVGINKLDAHFKKYEKLKAKSTNNLNEDISIFYANFSDINENNEKQVPTKIKIEFQKGIDVFMKTNGEGVIPLISSSGEAGTGKTTSFYFQINEIIKAKKEKGIDVSNLYFVKLGTIGSSYVAGGIRQIKDFFDKLDTFLKENPLAEIYILADEITQWLNLKEDLDENGHTKQGASKLDIEKAFCDRYDAIIQKRVVFMATDNRALDGLSSAVKTRFGRGREIVHIGSIELSVLGENLKNELAKNNIYDLNFSNNDLEIIKYVTGNNQRNENIIKEMINNFINVTKKEDRNTKNFLIVAECMARNQKRKEDKSFINESSDKKYIRNEKEPDFDCGPMLTLAMNRAGAPEKEAGVVGGMLGKYITCNRVFGLLGGLIGYWIAKSIEKFNIKESNFLTGAIGISSGLSFSGAPLLYWNWRDSHEPCKKFLCNFSNWKDAYMPDDSFLKSVTLPKPRELYQNMNHLKEVKNEDYQKLLLYRDLEHWRYSFNHDGNLFAIKESYLDAIDLLYYGNLPEDKILFKQSPELFKKNVIDHYNKKFKEFLLYIDKKCLNLKTIIEKIGLSDEKDIFNSDAMKKLIFMCNCYNGKINNYIALDQLEKNCNNYIEEHNVMKKYSEYCNDIVKLKKKENMKDDALILRVEEQYTMLVRLIRNLCEESKRNIVINKFNFFNTWKTSPNFKKLFLKNQEIAITLDYQFSQKVEAEIKSIEEKEKNQLLINNDEDEIDDEDEE